TFEEDDYIFGGLAAGAAGFLLKRTSPEELITAIHTIAAGDSLLSRSVTRRVIGEMAHAPRRNDRTRERLDVLTPREQEVHVLMVGADKQRLSAPGSRARLRRPRARRRARRAARTGGRRGRPPPRRPARRTRRARPARARPPPPPPSARTRRHRRRAASPCT